MRESGFELTNGESLIAALPKVDGEYDWATLSQLTQQLKRENPDVNDASVLMERTVKYDYLIQVMDTIRSAKHRVRRGVCSRLHCRDDEDGAVHEHRRGRSPMSLLNRATSPARTRS